MTGLWEVTGLAHGVNEPVWLLGADKLGAVPDQCDIILEASHILLFDVLGAMHCRNKWAWMLRRMSENIQEYTCVYIDACVRTHLSSLSSVPC